MSRQLWPSITLRDTDFESPEKAARMTRLVYETAARAFQELQRQQEMDPRFADTRVSHALKGMGNNIEFVDNPDKAPGSVMTLDDQYRMSFTAQPAMFIPPASFVGLETLTVPAFVDAGTSVERRMAAWVFPSSVLGTPASIGTTFVVPHGTSIELFLWWASTAGIGDASGFLIDCDIRSVAVGDAYDAAGTAQKANFALPTTSPITKTLRKTSLGTFATNVSSATLIRVYLKRDCAAENTATGSANAQSLGVFGLSVAATN